MNSIEIVKKFSELPWAITPETLAELDCRLSTLRPKTILECGSGLSTLIFARYAENNPEVKVVSLEHDQKYFDQTALLLGSLIKRVELLRCDLIENSEHSATDEALIYDVDLSKYPKFDFVLIDGPPSGAGGREQIFPWIFRRLNKDCEVWLDDGDRPQESQAIKNWKEKYNIVVESTRLKKGLKIIRFDEFQKYTPQMDDVIVTMLSGMRPELLDKTLDSLPEYVLNHMEGLANGGDEETRRIYEKYNVSYFTTPKMLGTGAATSVLAQLALSSNKTYWLAFQDDWEFVTLDDLWLTKAKEMLSYSNLVRLRHFSDKVSGRNLHTKENYILEKIPHGLMGNMHWTFNSTLQRCETISKVYPCINERDAMRKAEQNGLRVTSQLYPGCCKHIGGNDSLLDKVGRKANG